MTWPYQLKKRHLKNATHSGWKVSENRMEEYFLHWISSVYPKILQLTLQFTVKDNAFLLRSGTKQQREICTSLQCEMYLSLWVSLVFQSLKNPPAMQGTRVQSLGWEDPLEKEMATHSSILAWRIPQGQGSLVGCCLRGCTELDTTEAT